MSARPKRRGKGRWTNRSVRSDMIIACPSCGGELEVEAEWAGCKGQCPYCEESFIIPESIEPTDDAPSTPVAESSSSLPLGDAAQSDGASGTHRECDSGSTESVTADECAAEPASEQTAAAAPPLDPQQIDAFRANVKELARQLTHDKHSLAFMLFGILTLFPLFWLWLPFVVGELVAQRRTAHRRAARRLRTLRDGLPVLPETDEQATEGIARRLLGAGVLHMSKTQQPDIPVWLNFDRETVTMPELCVITGEPSKRMNALHGFAWGSVVAAGGIGAIWTFRHLPVRLPFSDEGWDAYRRLKPIYTRLLEAGLIVSAYIPLIPVDVAWLMLCGLGAPGLLGIEHLLGRQSLCAVIWTMHSRDKDPNRSFVRVPNHAFAAEFARLNPDARMWEDDHTWHDTVFGGTLERLGHCRTCGRDLKLQRRCPNVLPYAITAPFTLGLSLIPVIRQMKRGKYAWHCTVCGNQEVDEPSEVRVLPPWARASSTATGPSDRQA